MAHRLPLLIVDGRRGDNGDATSARTRLSHRRDVRCEELVRTKPPHRAAIGRGRQLPAPLAIS